MIINYDAEPTLARFHASDAFVRGVRGPVGSGKSVGMCIEIVSRAVRQEAYKGIRKSRWGVIRNCFDDKTEILTEKRGWKLFKDLLDDDLVAQLSNSGFLEFVKPSMYYMAPYVGEMIGFENEGIDFLVTPDHRLSVSKIETRAKIWSDYRFETAEECFGNGSYRIKRDAKWLGINPDRDESFFEWLGFWFAEGNAGQYNYIDRTEPHWRCVITQKKNLQYVRDLFTKAGLDFTETSDSGVGRFKLRVTPETKLLISELSKTGLAITKRIPNWIKNSPSGHLRSFIKGFVAGDGTVRKDCNCTIAFTSSRGLADDLQEMALKAGMVANINLKAEIGQLFCINGISGSTNAAFWSVTFIGNAKYQPSLKVQGYANKYRGWYKEQYCGNVYCLEVPTHRVYIRRNGVAHWSSQTYGELKSTTIKTWQDWFPDEIAPMRFDTPIISRMVFDLPDKTVVDLELLFISLDRPEDVKKLKSLELTGIWINEVSELPKAILDMATGRVGRYPAKREGGASWSGIIMDTNSPDDDHWYYTMAEISTPIGYEFFTQPGALLHIGGKYLPNPVAENVQNHSLGYEYWLRQVPGKADQWIKVFLLGQYGSVHDGKPVFPEWNDTIHVKELEPMVDMPLDIGLDFGLTPAAVIVQFDRRGRMLVVDELCGIDVGIRSFLDEILMPHLASIYPEWLENKDKMIQCWGDPAGKQRSQTDEKSCFDEVKQSGLRIQAASTNAFRARRDSVAWFLSRLSDGKPTFLLDPCCSVLRKGFNGGYKYRRIQVVGEERYTDEPLKNMSSHPMDALQYASLKVGGIVAVKKKAAPENVPIKAFEPFSSNMGY